MLTPDTTRVVISDVHGNHEALRKLLLEIGVIDDKGERQPGFFTVQVGDLVHLGHNSAAYDAHTVQFAEPLLDVVLCGNHELNYVWNKGSGFSGMTPRYAIFPETKVGVWEIHQRGEWMPAAAIDGWLITHAGVQPAFQRDIWIGKSAEEVADAINDQFEKWVASPPNKERGNMLFAGVGEIRGGMVGEPGGLFWCDDTELIPSSPHHFDQIVGHTPQFHTDAPYLWKVANNKRVWCIDPGPDRVAALVKKGRDADWHPVVAHHDRGKEYWNAARRAG